MYHEDPNSRTVFTFQSPLAGGQVGPPGVITGGGSGDTGAIVTYSTFQRSERGRLASRIDRYRP